MDFCLVYSNTTCSECQAGYYLDGGACVEGENPAGPSSCPQNEELFTIQNPCVKQENIVVNCAVYDSGDACTSCVEGYKLESGACVVK